MTLRAPSIIAVSALLLSSLLVVSGPPATAADPRKTFTNGGRTIVVDPVRRLRPGRYVLLVSTRVVDLARNHWDQKTVPGRQPLKLVFRSSGLL